MTMVWSSARKRQATATAMAVPASLVAAGIAVVTFGVYLATLAPDLYSLDSPELTTAAYRLGIAHPPGYPLYTLAGWLFSHAFPIGTVAFRLNVLSALFGSLAAVLVYVTALRLTHRTAVAAAGALALAFSYYFWLDALAAEIYTLDAALFAGLLLAALAWRDRPTAARAALVGLLFGLSLATRTTSALYAPALALFAWTSGERSARSWLAAGGGVLAGLSFYLYLPLRSAAGGAFGFGDYARDGTLRVADLATWAGFWDHITAAAFQGDAFAFGPMGMLGETGVFVASLAGAFLVVGLPLGIAGIVRAWRADRGLLLLAGGTALPVTVFFIGYGALDKEFMFLPSYVAWALFSVIGIDWALDVAVASAPAWQSSALVAGVALALPALALAVNWPLVTLHGERAVRGDAEAFLARVEPGAIVYGPFVDVAPFQYLQQVEGTRRDVRFVNSWTVDDGFLLSLADANVGTAPFYITRDQRVLRGRYALTPLGDDGYEVRPAR